MIANVRRFLAEIRARRRWSLHAGFALAPDTNIGGTSDERIIHIDFDGRRLPFRRDAEDLTTSGIGVSVWTGGEYQYPLGDGVRLRAGANLSRRDYAGSRFDQTFGSGHAGPRWLADRNTEASVLASVQRRWSAGAPAYDALGARAARGPDPFPARVGAQPGTRLEGLQPAGVAGARGAQDQRPALRLRAHRRRASLRKTVLIADDDVVEVEAVGLAIREDTLALLLQPLGLPSPAPVLRRIAESVAPLRVPVGGGEEVLDPLARREMAFVVPERWDQGLARFGRDVRVLRERPDAQARS